MTSNDERRKEIEDRLVYIDEHWRARLYNGEWQVVDCDDIPVALFYTDYEAEFVASCPKDLDFLLGEVDYWKRRALEAERQINGN